MPCKNSRCNLRTYKNRNYCPKCRAKKNLNRCFVDSCFCAIYTGITCKEHSVNRKMDIDVGDRKVKLDTKEGYIIKEEKIYIVYGNNKITIYDINGKECFYFPYFLNCGKDIYLYGPINLKNLLFGTVIDFGKNYAFFSNLKSCIDKIKNYHINIYNYKSYDIKIKKKIFTFLMILHIKKYNTPIELISKILSLLTIENF